MSTDGFQPELTRVNEYFVPKDGIRWDVIEEDITRYLGNDATVRKGVYEVYSLFLFKIRRQRSDVSPGPSDETNSEGVLH
jgi:hypothetical protein